jgi:hypothetical protein
LKPQQHNFYEPLDKDDPEFNRRSVYRMNVNTGRNPLLDALDCPAPSLTMPKRRSTTTPIQALALMNDSFVLRQAKRLAARVKKEAGDDVAAQVTLAHQLALGRMPTTTEQVWSARLAEQHGLPSLSWALLNASEFLCVE